MHSLHSNPDFLHNHVPYRIKHEPILKCNSTKRRCWALRGAGTGRKLPPRLPAGNDASGRRVSDDGGAGIYTGRVAGAAARGTSSCPRGCVVAVAAADAVDAAVAVAGRPSRWSRGWTGRGRSGVSGSGRSSPRCRIWNRRAGG